jgi:hypothetical protein
MDATVFVAVTHKADPNNRPGVRAFTPTLLFEVSPGHPGDGGKITVFVGIDTKGSTPSITRSSPSFDPFSDFALSASESTNSVPLRRSKDHSTYGITPPVSPQRIADN